MKASSQLKEHSDPSTIITSNPISDDTTTTSSSALRQQPNPTPSLKSKLTTFARRLSSTPQPSQTTTSTPSSAVSPKSEAKAMAAHQRRLESVSRYEQLLQSRIEDPDATQAQRDKASSEKRWFDRQTTEAKEDWVVSKMTLQDGWGAGVYGEGACPPGMVWR